MTELTAQERAGLALWLILQGPMTTNEVAARCGMSYYGARAMLLKLSRVVPLSHDESRPQKWAVDGVNLV